MSTRYLKPDMETTISYIKRDHAMMLLLCVSIILLALAAWVLNWRYQPVFFVMAFVAFLFMGQKMDVPDETWSAQQKASWSKRYTTLRVKDGALVYVYGDGPGDVVRYELEDIRSIRKLGNKLLVDFKDGRSEKIIAKYWPQSEVRMFIEEINELLQPGS